MDENTLLSAHVWSNLIGRPDCTHNSSLLFVAKAFVECSSCLQRRTRNLQAFKTSVKYPVNTASFWCPEFVPSHHWITRCFSLDGDVYFRRFFAFSPCLTLQRSKTSGRGCLVTRNWSYASCLVLCISKIVWVIGNNFKVSKFPLLLDTFVFWNSA